MPIQGGSLGSVFPIREYSVSKDGFSQKWTRAGLAEGWQIKMKVFDISDHMEKLANSMAPSDSWFEHTGPICL